VLTLGPGHVVFRIDGEHVAVTEAAVRVAGGELFIDAFEFSLAAPEPSVRAHIIGAEIAELLPLLPTVITAGTGRVDGSIELHWEPQGLRFGAGRLVLATGSTAEIKLAPTPGLISGSLPPAVSQYYDGILDLELGRMPIRAHVLEATFDPAGDAEGRTATVRLEGGPADPRLRAPVELSVNVRGPLESLLRLGMDSRLHFGGGR
jgi:Dicarboxylate transport